LPDVRATASEKQKFILHIDNSPIHCPKAMMERVEAISSELAPHRPDSPDLAPSDFFLFDYLKQQSPAMNSALQTS
jgi:hypothetical protein